jgi:hypothetical protein
MTPSNGKPLDLNNSSTSNQHTIILDALSAGNKTSIWLKENRGIMQPSARMDELRKKGNIITSGRVTAYTSDGTMHKGVAEYTLVKRADHE